MIQATGTIIKSDGVTSYVNPLINVYFSSPRKWQRNIISAQVCKEISKENEEKEIVLIEGGEFFRTTFVQADPTFEQAQAELKTALETAYPQVTFKIV